MKKLILLIVTLITFLGKAQDNEKFELLFADFEGNLRDLYNKSFFTSDNKALFVLGGKTVLTQTGAQVQAELNKIDSLTLPMSSLNVFDDGLTTQILVGGGLNTVPVWGTDLPTAVTIGSAYIYRVGGTDVVDADVADNITITNISQVGDITATATEINYTTDVTSNIQAQIDLKAPLIDPAFTNNITVTNTATFTNDSVRNIILPLSNTPTTPSLTFGDDGIYQSVDNELNISLGNLDFYEFNGTRISATQYGAGWSLLATNASYTVSTICPNKLYSTSGFGGSGDTVAIISKGTNVFKISDVGTQVGSPTGGFTGAGTINAVGVYDDNVLLTGADYVFSKNYEDYTQFSIPQMREYFKKEKHLPTIVSWEKKPENRPSIGKLAFQLLETVEVQAKYISELEERISRLEKKIQ